MLDDGAAVAELGGRLGVGGDAGELLDELGADLAGVVRRATADDLHAAERAGLAGVEVEAAEVGDVEPAVEAAAQRAGHRLGLVGDLLEQVVLVAAGVVVPGVPVDGQRLLGGGAGVHGEGVEAVGLEHGQLAVLQVDDLPGVADQGGDVGGAEHLLLADADDDGAAVAGDDDLAGALGVQDGDAVRADDALERLPDRILQRVGVLDGAGDEVGEHLGVGLGDEDGPVGDQLGAQLVGVLDDAVVDDGDALLAVQVRVGVDVIGDAVRGPAGVADAEAALEPRGDGRRQVGDPALDLAYLESLVVHHETGRVVASVLQALQTLQQDRGRVFRPDVGDNSTHFDLLGALAVHDAAQLAQGQLGCRDAACGQLGGDAGKDALVGETPGLHLPVAAPDVLLGGLREVGHDLGHHAGGLPRTEGRGPGQVRDQILIGMPCR